MASSELKLLYKIKPKEPSTTSNRRQSRTIERRNPRKGCEDVIQPKTAENLAERLKKWREEKQKKRELEKNSKKPLFKVTSNLQGSVHTDVFVKQLKVPLDKTGRKRRKVHCVQIKSPQEMSNILVSKKSPMVEMNRRKSCFLTSPGSSSSLTSQKDSFLAEGPDVALVDQRSDKDERVKYYRDLLSSETRRLNEMCSKWSEVLQVMSTLGEEIQGQIRATIGKAQLLIRQKFKQFSGLIENCQFGLGDKETTPTDLQGFWEMIFIQVEDVNRLFADLVQLEANQWTKPATPLHKPVNKRVALKNKVKGIKPKTTSKFASFRQEILKQKTKAAIAVNDCVDMATVQDLGNVGDTF